MSATTPPSSWSSWKQRRQELGEEKIREVEAEWAEIFAALRVELDAGTDPADPKLQPIGERARELLAMFTGGDPGIQASLKKMYETEGPEKASRGMADPEVFEYLAKVRDAAHSAR